jgi:hypothetical protein
LAVLTLVRWFATVDGVQDAWGSIAVDGVEHPAEEPTGFDMHPHLLQRVDGEGAVADPGVAVVPVALAAGLLR